MNIKKSLIMGKSMQYNEKNIIDMFEKCVYEFGNRIALSDDNINITYAQVNLDINKLARYIIHNCCGKQNVIGIYMSKSIKYIISIMAIIKSGNVYLPIAQELPEKRINEMCAEAGIKMVLTDNNEISLLNINFLDVSNDGVFDNFDDNNLQVEVKEEDIAYILYTSGTTGRPKGVMIKHIGIVNLIHWFNDLYHVENKKVLLLSNMGFDPSIEELFGAILTGGTLYIPPANILMHNNIFKDFINKNQINIIQFVPSVMYRLLENIERMDSLDIVISGGDHLDEKLKDAIIKKGYHLYNHYGPTEVSVDALASECFLSHPVTVGFPVHNLIIAILDEGGQLLPINSVGEMYIGGIGVAKGYINNEKQTNESFVKLSLSSDTTFYRTRDYAVMDENGAVRILGRADNQIKIRGKRIELYEISKEIRNIECIKECEVVVRQINGNDKIFAFYIAEKFIDSKKIIEYLSGLFPMYMIPNFFYELDAMPININCKIDVEFLKNANLNMLGIKNLDNITIQSIQRSDEILFNICKKVYNLVTCDIDINTFYHSTLNAIGVDSLSYMKLIIDIESNFGFEFEAVALSNDYFLDIESLCKYILEKNIPYEV